MLIQNYLFRSESRCTTARHVCKKQIWDWSVQWNMLRGHKDDISPDRLQGFSQVSADEDKGPKYQSCSQTICYVSLPEGKACWIFCSSVQQWGKKEKKCSKLKSAVVEPDWKAMQDYHHVILCWQENRLTLVTVVSLSGNTNEICTKTGIWLGV